jgi:hypothetical protein
MRRVLEHALISPRPFCKNDLKPLTSAAMTALQASIGALNDLVDARLDLGLKPGKPIPAGQVSPTIARVVLIGAAGAGFVLTVPSGPGLMAIAGLGLAIVAAIMQAHEGTVSVTSNPGEGATFTITMPAAPLPPPF